MKDQMLKIAGVKSEKEFYKKFPSEEAFMKAHGKEFNKAKLGNAIPKNQNAKYVLPRFDMPRAASKSTSMTYKTPTSAVSTATTGQKKEDVAASTKAMGNVRKKEAAKRKEKIAISKSARDSQKYNIGFTLPNGETKDYNDMTFDEKAYVTGKAAESVYDINSFEDENSNASLNDYNPLSKILAPMESAIGTALYRAQEEGSARPILSAIAEPVMTGALSGIFSPGKSNISALKSLLDPIKDAKEIAKLAAATGEEDFGSHLLKHALKKGSKKLKHTIVEGIENPSSIPEIPFNTTAGEGQAGAEQAFAVNPNNVLNAKFKQGGQLHKLQQLTDFGNPPIADMGMTMDGPIGSYISGSGQEGIARNNFLSNYLYQQQAQAAQQQAQTASAAQQSSGGGGLGDSIGKIIGMVGKGKAGVAKKGKSVPKYQVAPAPVAPAQPGPIYDPFGVTTMGGQTPQANVYPPYAPDYQGPVNQGAIDAFIPNATAPKGSGFMDMIGGVQGLGNLAGSVIGGIQQIGSLRKQQKSAETAANVAKVVNQAARIPGEPIKRKYVTPWMNPTNANERFPTYGVGTNYLSKNGSIIKAQDGSMIGGNPTEIQNMYNPGDIYSDLGYEPLNDSEIVKQYRAGGFIPRAEDGYSAADSLGGFLNTVGNSGNPISAALNFGTFAITDNLKRNVAHFQNQAKNLNQSTAMMNAGQGLHGQYSQFMEDGGWVSHNWNPQVITKFGDMDVSQIHSFATEGMDTLRTGGHITQNNMFPQDQYALGGELKTTWGGYAEPISHNPYMPGTGQTVMFRGKSHEESDGNGHTGIGVKYGEGTHDNYTDYAEYGSENADADVEVERGEPATEMIDPQTGQNNMVVFGNLKISPIAAAHIGDKFAKGKKFKNYVAELGKIEEKQNKIIEKSTNEINDLKVHTPFAQLKLGTLNANIIGANMKLKDIAVKKTNASAVQNAINETAEEHGIDADAFARGKIKIDKEAMKQQAKFGKQVPKAQLGDWFTLPGIAKKIYDLTAPDPKKGKQQLAQLAKKYNITPSAVKAIASTPTNTQAAAPPAVELPTDTPIVTTPKTQAATKKTSSAKSSTASTTKKTKPSGYVSKYGIDPWQGNTSAGDKYGKKTKSSFTAEEWDKIADKLGFKGKGNKEFEEFLLKDPRSKAIIEKRHKELYGKDPWIDPEHFGYGWAADELKDIPAEEQYQGEIPLVDISLPDDGGDVTTTQETTQPVEPNQRNKWMDFANQLLPYLRPSDQEPFDQAQLYPELYALASNKVEPVQAQLYHPDLDIPYDISLQDQMNANQADFNAIQRQTGYNPAATAALAAQKYAANSKVLGDQFRMNQAEKASVYDKNRQTLNDAQLKNLGILDTQMTRQETAKSKTKEQAIEALKSMTDKIAKNKLENRTLGIYENLYNYRFGKDGKAQNWNPLAQYDISLGGSGTGTDAAPEGYEYETILKKKKKDKDESRNGSIVKAIKNL